MTHMTFTQLVRSVFLIGFITLLLAGHSYAAPAEEGTPVSITGELTVLYMDDFENKRAELQYFIKDKQSKKQYRLQFDGTPPGHLRSGATVKVRGKARGRGIILAADGEGEQSIEIISPAAVAVTGEQKTLVMVADFLDKSVPCSVDSIRDIVFTDPSGNSIDDLYRETSFDQVWLTGEVVGRYQLNTTTESCDLQGWSTAADAAALADGVNVDAYDRKVYVLPPGGCSGAGYGSVLGNPTRAWILKCDFRDVYAHELGHNLGMAHASTPGCEYCDITDFMGTGNNKLRHNNAPHKDQMGWLQGAQVQTITQSGTYDIAPLEPLPVNTLAPQAIKIFKADSGEYYYLSYRRAIGFDTSLSPISQLDRLAVHRATGDGSGGNTYLLAQLTDGESHVDPVNGVTITVISHNSDYVTVEVGLDGTEPAPTCTAGIPQTSLSPSSQSANAGSTLNYTVSVTNQDSDACAGSSFALSDSIPSGWGGTVSPASLSLAPGQTGTAVLSVASATSATASTYSVGVSVIDTSEAVHSASASASYTVVQACATAAPGLSLSPDSQSGETGATLAYTLSLMNNDSAACSTSTFDLTITSLPGGWDGSLSTWSLSVAPGATGTATLSVTSAQGETAGNYGVQLGTADAQEPAHARSTTATYVVNESTSTGDAEAPTVPSGMAASANFKQVSLSWSASSDNVGVTGYRVYRDGVAIASTVETGYTDRDGASNVMYEYTVDAYDAMNNTSARSAPVTAGKAKAKGGGSGGGGGKGKGRIK